MREFWENIKARLQKLGEEEIKIFGRGIKRSYLLLAAVLIVAIAILAPIVVSLSNREVSLELERTDIEPGRTYRVNDGIVFYETPNHYVSIDPNNSTHVEQIELYVDADGYDMSSSVRLLYLGSSAQIWGQDAFVMGGGETILSGRAGRRYAALLYRNQYGDSRILLVDALARPTTQVIATIPIAGGEVTAFGFLEADDTELLWVSTVDVNQFSEESLVRVYNCDREGALIFYSASFYNQTIEDVMMTRSCLYLIGTQDLVRYDRTEDGFSSERARVSIYGSRIVACKESEDRSSAYFVTLPETDAGEQTHLFRLLTVSQSDEAWATVLQQFMPSPIVSAFLQNNRVCIVTEDAYEEYTYAGKSQLTLELDVKPTSVIPAESSFLLFTDTAVYRATVS